MVAARRHAAEPCGAAAHWADSNMHGFNALPCWNLGMLLGDALGC